MSCLDDRCLQGLLQGTLEPHDIARIDAHIDLCETCWELVSDVVQARSAEPTSVEAAARRSATIVEETAALASARADVHGSAAEARTEGRRYVLLGLIGAGGMGRVYRATDRLTGENVALKRVPVLDRGSAPTAHAGRSTHTARSATRRDDLAALAQEFRTLATLRHPNIISVLDYGFDAVRRPYFTMELLGAARPVLPFAGRLALRAQIELLAQILRALGYLHRRRVVHGDLKPSNLLVVDGPAGPTVKVLDFGLSVVADEAHGSHAGGTLPYMAPELLRGGAPSEASDLYAVGVVAYEMLAGRHPFYVGARGAEYIADVLRREPDLSRIWPELRTVIGRALCKSPDGRPADAAAFLEELCAAADVPTGVEPAPARDSHLAAARFIGRDEELDVLRGSLDAARAGSGLAWLVGGESGIGKSRLLDELRCAALVDGVLVVRGQAIEGGTAYHVWKRVLELLALHVELGDLEASVLRAVLPNLPALLERDVTPPPDLDVQITRARILNVLRDVVERSRDPVLVLLEDLQWADAESLALLAQVSADLAALPLLVVGSYRDDEARRLPADLPAMQTLSLPRFERTRVAELCASMLGPAGRDARLVDLVARETEGNTFFIVEVLRALADESGRLEDVGRRGLPERILAGGVEQVFRRRIERVPADARALLRLAAVAGRQLDRDVLARGVPRFDELVAACADAGVLEVHDQRWRFSHDKLRERVLGEIAPAEARELHARVAESLEAAYPDSGAHAGQIAHHFREASSPSLAARYYALAGEAALARGAPGEAEAMLDQARAIHVRLGAPALATARVWRGLAQARFALGRFREADVAIEQVCAAAGAPVPTDALGFGRAMGRQLLEQLARRAGLAKRLRLDPRGPEERALAEELMLGLSVQEVYVWLGQPERLLLFTLCGLNLEDALDSRRRTYFRGALAFLLSYTPLRTLSRRHLERRAATIPAGTQAEIDYQRNRAMLWLNEGDWQEATAAAARAVAYARAARDDTLLMHSLLQLTTALTGLDAFHGVLEAGAEMEQLAARGQNPRYAALALLLQATAWLRFGDLAKADAIVTRAREYLPHELGPVPESVIVGLAALCALQLEQHERAEELAAVAMDAVERSRFAMVELRYGLTCVLEVYLDPAHYARHAREIPELCGKLRGIARLFPLAQPQAWMLDGRHAWTLGQPKRAAASLKRAVAAADRVGAKYEQALTRYWLGRFAQTEGGRRAVPEGAELHLRESLRIFEGLGYAWDVARGRRALGE